MNDYIERERALAMLHKDEFGTPDERWHPESEIAEAILRIPAADVAPVVHGRWVNGGKITMGIGDAFSRQMYRCSECDFLTIAKSYNYCPSCGAKMDGGGSDGEH